MLLSLALLFLCRLLVTMGGPTTLNFAHFPLAALAMIKLLERPGERSDRALNLWLLASLLFTLAAAALTSWQAVRPFVSFTWQEEPAFTVLLAVLLGSGSRLPVDAREGAESGGQPAEAVVAPPVPASSPRIAFRSAL